MSVQPTTASPARGADPADQREVVASAAEERVVESLIACVMREKTNARVRRNRRLAVAATTVAVLLALTLTDALSAGACFWLIVCGLFTGWSCDQALMSRRNLARKLRATRHPRAVGALAMLAADRDPDVARLAADAFNEQAPNLTEPIAANFDEAELRAILTLSASGDAQVRLALASALARFEDARCAACLCAMLEDPVLMVRERAESLLPGVYARVAAGRERTILLRAAAETDPAQTLLRCAGASTTGDTSELLRVAISGDPEEQTALTNERILCRIVD